jgi:hypothetical protein
MLSFAQDTIVSELSYEVNITPPPFSMSKEELPAVETIIDINRHYKSSWIRTFISVEFSAVCQGQLKKALGQNDTLTQEQKDLIQLADVGSDISVKMLYMPENTLSHNDVKDFGFTFKIKPENNAAYPGGQTQLKQYLKVNAIDKIPADVFEGYALAILKFTVTETGEIVNADMYWPSKNKDVDNLLLDTICNMPKWKPATYANGKKVKQAFALTVGNHESCAIHLLNLSQYE